MAEYGSQQWKDNISLAKRIQSERRRRQIVSVEEYREEIVEERRQIEEERATRIRIDFESFEQESMQLTRPFSQVEQARADQR